MADHVRTVSDSDDGGSSGFSEEASGRPQKDGKISSTKSSSGRSTRRRSTHRKGRSPDARPRKRTRTGSSTQKSKPNQTLPPEISSDTETDPRQSRLEETESSYFVPKTPHNKGRRPRFHNTSTSHDSTTSTRSGGSSRSVPTLFSPSGSEQRTPLTPPSADSGVSEARDVDHASINDPSSSQSPCPPPRTNRRRREAAQINDLSDDDQTDEHVETHQRDMFTQTDDFALDEETSDQSDDTESEVSGQAADPTLEGQPHTNGAATEVEFCEICGYTPYRKKEEEELDHDLRELLLDGPIKQPPKKAREAASREAASSETSSTEPKRGYNYIHFRKSHVRFVKLGWAEVIPRRRKQLESDSPRSKRPNSEGKFDVLPGHALETVRSNMAIQYYKFAERLIHKELHNKRHVLGDNTSPQFKPDGCTEWFKVSIEEATQVRDKWVKWLDNCEPYDDKGEIKPFWHRRIERRGNYEDQKEPRSLHSFWLKVLHVPLYERVFTWCCTFVVQSKSKSHTIYALLLKDVLQVMFHTNVFSLWYAFYFFFSFLIYVAWIVDFGSIVMKESIKQVVIVVVYTLLIIFLRANLE